jgi:hypothetical protein
MPLNGPRRVIPRLEIKVPLQLMTPQPASQDEAWNEPPLFRLSFLSGAIAPAPVKSRQGAR